MAASKENAQRAATVAGHTVTALTGFKATMSLCGEHTCSDRFIGGLHGKIADATDLASTHDINDAVMASIKDAIERLDEQSE